VALEMAKKALGDTVLRAPYNGVVVKKMASVGDYATSMPPTVIMVLMEISTLELKISLPEPDLQRVKQGSAVEVHFPSMERTIIATVTRIIRNVDTMTRSFTVVVEIPNKDMSLKPGLYARVKIATSKPRRRILVPTEAVVDEGNGVHAVFIVDGGTARRRKVRVAAASKGETEIISGLAGSETLVLTPSGLLDGDKIKTKDSKAAVKAHAPTAEVGR
jgi:membrane fusion protein (multidrug efflux system)